jgi:DNA mismatch repair protein MutL
MSRIRPLPPALVCQIAAGEVVERPAGALKELVENSLDAGARRIDVEVSRGGTDLIRVVDDGSGIHPDDLGLALANHATSKVASADDLAKVGTLGFRGEALASLGAVAQVRLQSRPPELPVGAEVSAQGGNVSVVRAWSGPAGTRVEVKHLFYNTPARRKFLRSVPTELGHVQEAFTRLALSRLGVHLTLTHDGRLLSEAPGPMGLLDRVGLFFGAEVANSLYAVQAEHEGVTVAGYVGDPSCDRSGPSLQYLFVNGWWVRDRGVFQAVQEAYKGLLMTGRHPAAFLFLELPPGLVDVNAHPAKAEVRFRDRGAVHALAARAVRDRLDAADLTARATPSRKVKPDAPRVDIPSPRATTAEPATVTPPTEPTRDRSAARQPVAPAGPPARGPVAVTAPAQGSGTAGAVNSLFTAPTNRPEAVTAEPSPLGGAAPARAMQVLGCYLVVEVPPDEVLFIDQHALHERILFERLLARMAGGPMESQRLLVPEAVDLPAEQAALVLEHREELADLGLLVEEFGGTTVLLGGYPVALGQQPPAGLLRAVAEHLAEHDRPPERGQLLHDLAALTACHAAVRAGDRLTDEEMQELLAQRDLVGDAHHCPHGRPTALVFGRRDLEKLFKRA